MIFLKKFKTAKKIIFSFFIFLFVFQVNINANQSYNWYFKPNNNGTQPKIAPELAFIEEYGGIFVDKEHGDNCADKVIYLTFDVGYENGNVEKILDILKKHNATGTFFVLKNVVEKETNLIKRMFNEGHIVANHTMSHKNMSNATNSELKAELFGLEELCIKLTGEKISKMYRAPEGCFSRDNMELLNELGYKTIFWSNAYADWDNNKQMNPEAALSKLLGRLHNGQILLLHPTSATNVAIMDKYLTALEEKGYRFGNLEELCNGL